MQFYDQNRFGPIQIPFSNSIDSESEIRFSKKSKKIQTPKKHDFFPTGPNKIKIFFSCSAPSNYSEKNSFEKKLIRKKIFSKKPTLETEKSQFL